MKYFIIAGEASGDLHASALMRELKKIDDAAEFCFLGGDLMKAQGGRMVKHYRQMAFMGVVAVLKNARTVLQNMSDCREAMSAFQPDLLILIDYPSFNLRMAKFAKKMLNIPVYYYISPKIWAWKEYRIKSIKRYVDKMFTILPFETEFYAKHNFPVEYVGNPSVDSVCLRPNQEESLTEFCAENSLNEKPMIAILAGSRKQEIKGCLPRMLSAALQFKDYQVIVAGAPGVEPEFYQSVIQNPAVHVVFGQTYELLQQSRAAVVNSGTATLETALVGVPQVVVYHIPCQKLGFFVKNLVVQVKYISLVNLIVDKELVKELMAHLFTVENVVTELGKLLPEGIYRTKILKGYDQMKYLLGEPGAAEHCAKKMLDCYNLQNKI